MKTRIICIVLAGAILLSLAGCTSGNPEMSSQSGSTETQPESVAVPEIRGDLMQTVTATKKEPAPITPEAVTAASDFAVRLVQTANRPKQNTLIAPLSVLCALAMVANGAEEETLLQMESTLGMRRDLYNDFFHSYLTALHTKSASALRLANSIWFADRAGFVPKEDFLKANAACYGADAYLSPFDDSTVQEINGWVSQKTDGMIPKVMDQIPPMAVMYLINALAFDAEWSQIYDEDDVSPDVFTAADGTLQVVEFLRSWEQDYLSDDSATGFIKYYKGERYAFVALLPNEGISVEEYLESLDGEKLQNLIAGSRQEDVHVSMPKFEMNSSLELSETLKAMGMELPFDGENADFSGIGTSQAGNLYISSILHKAYISVDEKGTKAAAATIVEMEVAAAEEEEPKYVKLDRPFVYMLIDCNNNFPFLIGTVQDLEDEQY